MLAEFTTMYDTLNARSCTVSHAEVPAELYKEPKTRESSKRKNEDFDSKESNKRIATNPNTWHPKLRAALEAPLRKAQNPSFGEIMKFCGVPVDEVYKLFGNNRWR